MRDCLKIGQTTREVKSRVVEQLKTAVIQNYRIEPALEATQQQHGADAQRCDIVHAQEAGLETMRAKV